MIKTRSKKNESEPKLPKTIKTTKTTKTTQKKTKGSKSKDQIEPKKSTGRKVKKPRDIKVTPYREIILSDNKGFLIKTTCNLTSDNQIQVIQYREHVAAEGMKFACTEPIYFENKTAFLDWLVELLKKNFDEIPYITISPIDEITIKKHEREAQDTMYL
ncbi:MAG: hypothetical protein KAJ51_01090 [Thermoplasmata archaeon]|nr:hypothetical protein [Thermoplasmata archaeon]